MNEEAHRRFEWNSPGFAEPAIPPLSAIHPQLAEKAILQNHRHNMGRDNPTISPQMGFLTTNDLGGFSP
jgi:hypothetical protein